MMRVNSDSQIDLNQLYIRMYPAIRTYVLQNSGTEPEAKDIFQEAVLAAWLNLQENKFDGSRQDFDGYIYTIAKNKWLDIIKSKRKKTTTSLNGQAIITDTSPYQEKDAHRLLQSIKKLDFPCKKALELFYFKKQSLKEIGEELGYSESVMKTKKYRCMLKLREIYLNQDKKTNP